MKHIATAAMAAALALGTAAERRAAREEAAAPVRASAQTTPYRVLHRTVLGGDGGWDYLTVDGPGRRVFMSRGTHVMVVSLRTDSLAGDIPA
ncbi:MAG: hypothetical protein ACJ8J0_26610, partial [Longimicrobiaceae bacterium]